MHEVSCSGLQGESRPRGPSRDLGCFPADPRATFLASFLGELQGRDWGKGAIPQLLDLRYARCHPQPTPRGTELAGAGQKGAVVCILVTVVSCRAGYHC